MTDTGPDIGTNRGTIPVPSGFLSHVANVGIKDSSLDFALIACAMPCSAAGVFTRSRFAGPSVKLSRQHLADGRLRAIVVVSKNANVATGAQGEADATSMAEGVAAALGIAGNEVAVAATGVIGRPLPMGRINAHVWRLARSMESESDSGESESDSMLGPLDIDAVARAIMTTDTVPKTATARVGSATISAVAKGVGMISPDMATLLAFLFTDAEISSSELDAVFRRVAGRTFNRLSIDTDTSTSDSAIILASGLAGKVDEAAFEEALFAVALSLVRQIARDGEGATKLLEVTVDRARDEDQAVRVARLIVDSPLVKTAVHGADPNWGRVAMAVGKAPDEDIDPDRVVIRFGTAEVYPRLLDAASLEALSKLLAADEVGIHVSLGTGTAQAKVWGCDLSAEYVRINAEYTT